MGMLTPQRTAPAEADQPPTESRLARARRAHAVAVERIEALRRLVAEHKAAAARLDAEASEGQAIGRLAHAEGDAAVRAVAAWWVELQAQRVREREAARLILALIPHAEQAAGAALREVEHAEAAARGARARLDRLRRDVAVAEGLLADPRAGEVAHSAARDRIRTGAAELPTLEAEVIALAGAA